MTGSKVQRNVIISHPKGGNVQNARPHMNEQESIDPPDLSTTDMDFNLYYHPTDPKWAEEHLKAMGAVGNEINSVVGDPLFVNPAGGDFSFKSGSPALELGIEPLDVTKMGRLKES